MACEELPYQCEVPITVSVHCQCGDRSLYLSAAALTNRIEKTKLGTDSNTKRDQVGQSSQPLDRSICQSNKLKVDDQNNNEIEL